MHSSLIGKIQKAHQYADEPERIDVNELRLTLRGDHDTHQVSYRDDRWHCSCTFFAQWETCSHVMAVQRVLGPITPHERHPDERMVADAV